jgi:hypothetical protein
MFAEAPLNAILYPMFALFALVAIVFLRMRSLRFAAVRTGEVSVKYYQAFSEGAEPDAARVVARNFANLFEVPVLFYVISLMTYVTHRVTWWMVALAWLYVALRYAHSYVHLSFNDVIVRFGLYLASGVVLALMWATLLFELVTSEIGSR